MYHAQAMMNSFPLFSDLHQFDNITPYFMADPICRYGSMLYLQLNWAEQQEQLINLTYSCSTCHVLWTALDGMHPFSLFFFFPLRLVLRYWNSWTMIPVSLFDLHSFCCSSFSTPSGFFFVLLCFDTWLDFLFDCFFFSVYWGLALFQLSASHFVLH